MAKGIHKGTELNNVKETWDQNEKQGDKDKNSSTGLNKDLQQTISQEAEEYDNVNKEERTLGGERGSVNDDGNQ
jgi:hypothetical protein